jgi:hypothetical protein
VTRDGNVVDYREQDVIAEQKDFDAWLARLVALDVDYVVLIAPDPPEAAWVRGHPELFTLVSEDRAARGMAYRFNNRNREHQVESPALAHSLVKSARHKL